MFLTFTFALFFFFLIFYFYIHTYMCMYPVVKGSTSQCSLHFSSLRCGLEKKKKRKDMKLLEVFIK